jgi:chromosomal replication initiation ATPase DnaA
METVFDAVESAFLKDSAFARNLKIYLCHPYTGEKLKSIGKYFGLSESAVFHDSKQAKVQVENDKKLKIVINAIVKEFRSSRFKI